MATGSEHPLRLILDEAAHGRFPTPDGSTSVLPTAEGEAAVVALTAAHFVLADVTPDEIRDQLDPTDIAAAMRPSFLAWLAEHLGRKSGFVDVLMARLATGGSPELLHRVESHKSARVARAERHRTGLLILATADGASTVTIGRGLADRTEISVELPADQRFSGFGRILIGDGLRAVPPGQAVFAQVSPGNAASVRAFLAAGFRPIGSEVLFSNPA